MLPSSVVLTADLSVGTGDLACVALLWRARLLACTACSAALRSSEAWLVRVSQRGNLDSLSRIPSSMEMQSRRCHVRKGR
jgi:hypothetical protein